MLGIIIGFTQSPWLAKTTFVDKKDSVPDPVTGFRKVLRMVHTYCALNNATIKSNYPMKNLEPIINDLAKDTRQYYFTSDAANGYWAVPLLAEHAYKTAFNTILGQCCYLRMGMGLLGAPHTYAMLKDITFGPIPHPAAERSLHEVVGGTQGLAFKYFFDDDYGAADDFDTLYSFLADSYFPRMSWAMLTIKPSKAEFMMPSMSPLGLEIGEHLSLDGSGKRTRGVKASLKKLSRIVEYPTPQNFEELEQFLYLTIYLKMFIPGRADQSRVLKEACTWEWIKESEVDRDWLKKSGGKVVEVPRKKQGAKKKETMGKTKSESGKKQEAKVKVRGPFQWGVRQQTAFEAMKKAVAGNVCVGNDFTRRHYLSVDTSVYGFGLVFFQLDPEVEKAMESKKNKTFPKGKEKIVHFISQRFEDTETRYTSMERICLAVLRSLEEVRWMAAQSRYPIITYANQQAMSMLLKGDNTVGRLAGWQARMAEYRLEVRHVKGGEVDIATGLASMPYDLMDVPMGRIDDWAGVSLVGSVQSKQEVEADEGGNEDETMAEAEDVSSDEMILVERIFKPVEENVIKYIVGEGICVGEMGMLVYCDGACQGNGTEESLASVGVYCGEGHVANWSGRLEGCQTNQTAELTAVLTAIVIGVRLLEANPRRKQLIIASDSEYACKGLTEWIISWRAIAFKKVKNRTLFMALDEKISELEESGIQVKLWKIPRAENMRADQLARMELVMMVDRAVERAEAPEDEGVNGDEEREEAPEDEGVAQTRN